MITIYTDGSANWKTGEGGFGVYMIHHDATQQPFVNGIVNEACKCTEEFHYQGFTQTKTGRMELTGILVALKLANKSEKIQIYCDSQYAVNTCNKWLEKWKLTGIQNQANSDILFELEKYLAKFSNLQIDWVKGHRGNIGNEIADILAREGYKSKDKLQDNYNIKTYLDTI